MNVNSMFELIKGESMVINLPTINGEIRRSR